MIHHEINFKLFFQHFPIFRCSDFDNTNIHTVSPVYQFIIDCILHQVCFFKLPEIKKGISKSEICINYKNFFSC